MVAEIRDSARVDFGPFRNVGHEDLHLDDVFRSGAGRPEAFVHRPDGDIELGDNVGRDAPVLRLPYDTSDPDVGAGTSDVAIVADWRSEIRNDDALDAGHDYLA